RALLKDVEIVLPGRHIGDGELAASRGGRVPGSRQHRDDGAHGGVNIAEDADDAGELEGLRFVAAGLVEAGVEGLAAEVRKGVVKDGVEVRKIDGAADRDGEDVRGEVAVFLPHLLVFRRRGGSGTAGRL